MDSQSTPTLVDQAKQRFGELNLAETKLFNLAQETFQELSDSEYRLFRAIANGEPIDYRTHDEAQDNPENATNWGAERTLRGERLRWLCGEPEIWKLCLPQGIEISGAKVEGSLNLNYSDVEIPLVIFRCYFAEAILLRQAKLRQLELSGSYIETSKIKVFASQLPIYTSIAAESLNIEGSVLLNGGFKAKGTVLLDYASIGGELDCQGGSFSSENKISLSAQGANVAKSVFLRNGFQIKGMVSFAHASVGGNFECIGGTFENGNGIALVAECLKVKGNLLLTDGFQAKGMINLSGAVIEGFFSCKGGSLTNDNGDALLAETITALNGVYLNDGFQARGTINLNGAIIGKGFICKGGSLNGDIENALLAQKIDVAGTVFLSDGFRAKGVVNLALSTITGDLACGGGIFTNENGYALVAEGINVTGNVFLCNGFQSQGTVSLASSSIGRNFDCTDGIFADSNWAALAAYNLNVGGNVYLSRGFKARGVVSFVSSVIGGDFYCSRGKFTNSKGDALLARSINVQGGFFLNDDFEPDGRVSFVNARIGNTLQIAQVKAPKKMLLDLQFARVQTLEYAKNSFPEPGNLHLNGLLYEALTGVLPNSSTHLLPWLRLQPKIPFSSQPYEHMARILQSTGKGDEAVKVLIGREEDELQYGELGWFSKAWKWFLGKTIAYGYRPERAIFWSLGVITVGALLFNVGYQNGLIPPTDKDCDRAPSAVINDCPNHPNYQRFNPVIYSLDVFLPIIDLRLKNTWLPSATRLQI